MCVGNGLWPVMIQFWERNQIRMVTQEMLRDFSIFRQRTTFVTM